MNSRCIHAYPSTTTAAAVACLPPIGNESDLNQRSTTSDEFSKKTDRSDSLLVPGMHEYVHANIETKTQEAFTNSPQMRFSVRRDS